MENSIIGGGQRGSFSTSKFIGIFNGEIKYTFFQKVLKKLSSFRKNYFLFFHFLGGGADSKAENSKIILTLQ